MLRSVFHHIPAVPREASPPQQPALCSAPVSSPSAMSARHARRSGMAFPRFPRGATAAMASSALVAVGSLSACGQLAPRLELPPSGAAPLAAGFGDAGPEGLLAYGGPDGSDIAAGDAAVDAEVVAASDAGAAAEEVPAAIVFVGDGGVESPCPADMKLVDTDYCPNIERKCLDEEYSPQNRIVICHRFARESRCLAPAEHKRFCMDEYEYPNRAGAHPPWMVSWYDAQATCQLQQKRVCFESEWVSACEGPERMPFPYGYARDNAKCNIDNMWIEPSLAGMYSKNPDISGPELSRLDQSVPSGAREECVSGFGVHDLTGNFDEWVTADVEHKDKSQWAGLKGGAWGHVRNACRPVTTSHPPDFTYYFIAFRCCKDAADAPPYNPPGNPHIPVVAPEARAPLPEPVNPPGPSEKKVGREHWGR